MKKSINISRTQIVVSAFKTLFFPSGNKNYYNYNQIN